MTDYNYDDTPAPKKPRMRLGFWDLLSILTLLAAVGIGLFFIAIYIRPDSAINPFPASPAKLFPTPTITPIQLQPTWTAAPENVDVTPTQTLIPTITLEPSITPVELVTSTPSPTPTEKPKAPFSATVTYVESTIFYPESGCDWQGVGGTIVDSRNADMLRITVRLVGFYNGKSKNELTVSSIAPSYGTSGYEFFLGTEPINSNGLLYLQILDQAGLPLSDNVYIDTFKDCSKNLVLVRFKKNP